jgi:hypothetical protein
MSDPKNQHIIPQCYLKQFVDPKTPTGYEPYVWIFERDTKVGKKKAPINILAKTDFYTYKGDYTIETSLAQLESDYALIFEKKIKNKIPLDAFEHAIFCGFVAAMLQRTLKQKEHIENQIDGMIAHIKQMEIAHGVEPKTSLEWEEAKKDAHKMQLVEMAPEIAKILSKMNIAFLCSDNKKVSYITSDSPAYLFNSQTQFHPFYSPAFGQKHVEVRMPLSPEISVCFSWINNVRGYLVATEDMVHNDNRMIFGHSHQYFISNSEKVKRRWFRRMPLDPIFLLRYLKHKIPMQIARWRQRKYYVRKK